MDYKELIDRVEALGDSLKAYFGGAVGEEFRGVCSDAATAIKTLLAERDAAAEKMRGNCDECVNADTPAQEYPCYFCRFSVYGKNSGTEHWKWRGSKITIS